MGGSISADGDRWGSGCCVSADVGRFGDWELREGGGELREGGGVLREGGVLWEGGVLREGGGLLELEVSKRYNINNISN